MRRMSDPTSRTKYSGPGCCPEKGRSDRDAGPAADVELSHFPPAIGCKPEARCVDLLCPPFISLAGYSVHSSNPMLMLGTVPVSSTILLTVVDPTTRRPVASLPGGSTSPCHQRVTGRRTQSHLIQPPGLL